MNKRPKWKNRLEKIDIWLKRYHTWFIVIARFIPGFRTVSSLAIGMSGVPLGRFIFLNAIGALLWASVISISGFLSGQILKVLLGEIKHLELPIFTGIAVTGAAIWAFSHYRGGH